MRLLTLSTAAIALAFAGGCIDLPVDDWERGHAHGPGYYRSNYYKTPGGSYRSSESVQVIPGNAQTQGTTNIYVGSVYPNGYAVPVYPVYAGNGYGYGNGYGSRYGGSHWNAQATGTYKGVNYGVGYGGNAYGSGGYGYAGGTQGKTSWSASYGSASPYGSGYGGRNSYGIYGNGNGNQGSNVTPSRFSTYR